MSVELQISKTLIGQADDIAAAHEHFTTHYVVGGRMALYSLLGDMLALINSFEAAPDREDLIAAVKQRLRSEFGIKTQRNSSDVAVLIRYMTRADRKTAHVYTRAIEAARAAGVVPEQVPAFIEGVGGVERIRAVSANANTSTEGEDVALERIALTEEYLSCRAELPLADFEATAFLDQFNASGVTYAYFVCTRKGDGKFHVISPLPPTAEFERVAIRYLSQMVCKDKVAAQHGIASLRRRADEVIKARRADEAVLVSNDTDLSTI